MQVFLHTWKLYWCIYPALYTDVLGYGYYDHWAPIKAYKHAFLTLCNILARGSLWDIQTTKDNALPSASSSKDRPTGPRCKITSGTVGINFCLKIVAGRGGREWPKMWKEKEADKKWLDLSGRTWLSGDKPANSPRVKFVVVINLLWTMSEERWSYIREHSQLHIRIYIHAMTPKNGLFLLLVSLHFYLSVLYSSHSFYPWFFFPTFSLHTFLKALWYPNTIYMDWPKDTFFPGCSPWWYWKMPWPRHTR